MADLIYGPTISCKLAEQKGLSRYFTGKRCKHGHLALRITANKTCTECMKSISNRHDYKRYHENPAFNARRKADSKAARMRAPEKYALHRLKWVHKQDPEKLRARNQQTLQARRDSRPHLRIKESLSTRLRDCVVRKRIKTMELLGCSIETCCQHLESKFQPGMTWENYGQHGWHIDHIRPCASFDLTDPEQQRECFHYTNLQPLWAEDNIRKSDKWKAVA